MNPIRKKIESKKWLMYFTATEYNGTIDAIIVDNNGRAITVWMDEEPIINDGKYLLKYQKLDGEKDGITRTRAKYLMIAMGHNDKTVLHFFPTQILSKGIMFEDWRSIESKKMDGKYFEIPIEWMQKIRGAKKL
mgnify:CR=1 FL=1